MLSFFPRDVLDEIVDLTESVSEGFLPTLTSYIMGAKRPGLGAKRPAQFYGRNDQGRND